MDYTPPESETKIVTCQNCGAEVTVNANYPIERVLSCPHCPPDALQVTNKK